ncbi:hypothetical protein AOLI_G00238260 [Acnodon oligacanthus]
MKCAAPVRFNLLQTTEKREEGGPGGRDLGGARVEPSLEEAHRFDSSRFHPSFVDRQDDEDGLRAPFSTLKSVPFQTRKAARCRLALLLRCHGNGASHASASSLQAAGPRVWPSSTFLRIHIQRRSVGVNQHSDGKSRSVAFFPLKTAFRHGLVGHGNVF